MHWACLSRDEDIVNLLITTFKTPVDVQDDVGGGSGGDLVMVVVVRGDGSDGYFCGGGVVWWWFVDVGGGVRLRNDGGVCG